MRAETHTNPLRWARTLSERRTKAKTPTFLSSDSLRSRKNPDSTAHFAKTDDLMTLDSCERTAERDCRTFSPTSSCAASILRVLYNLATAFAAADPSPSALFGVVCPV